jgi:ABC-type bacteriocin/lantibiotic exporter with double-glycine peptidase domain
MDQAPGSPAPTRASASIGRAPVPGLPDDLRRRLVESALSSLGLDPVEALGRVAPGRAAPAATWQETLEEALAALPLRTRATFLSAREALGAASAQMPLVTVRAHPTRGPQWIALVDRIGGRTHALVSGAEDRWTRPRDLADLLGLQSPDDPVPWMLVEPLLPAGATASPGGTMKKLSPARRLLALAHPDRQDLWTVVLYAIVIGALTLATPIAVQQLVNSVAFGGLIQPVVVLALLLFAVLAFSAVLTALQAYVAEQLQRRVFVRVTMDVAQRLPRVRIDAFDRQHGPEIVNRIFDVFTVQKEGAALLLDGTTVVLQTVVGLLVLSFYHPLMLGFSALLVASIAFVVTVLGRSAVPTAVAESNAKYAVAGWLEELARHPVAFHNSGGRAFAIDRADRLASTYITMRHQHFRIVLRQISGTLGLQVLASSLLLGLGGALVVDGQLTLGQLVASELIITAIVAAVAKLGKHLESLYDLLAAADKLGVLFDLPLEEDTGRTIPRADAPAAIEAHAVSCELEGRTVFRELSLRVDSGDRIALVGPTGSGKSVLLNLITGLRRPSSGYITLDGVDIRLHRLDALRECVASVGEAEIFSGSVLDNVRMSRVGISAADVDAALSRIGLAEEIRALPDGLDTPLSTDGWPLSPGQVACLMLARAIVARPRLLLLDEAFANIEEPLRKKVLDGVFSADTPWTIIAVSDRPDVLRRCSRMIEIPSGETRPTDSTSSAC